MVQLPIWSLTLPKFLNLELLWGSRRWAIEGFFKTAKYRFGLASFGQQTLLGVYRWLILSLLSFVLTHWVYLSSNVSLPPQWRQASKLALAFVNATNCGEFTFSRN